MTSALAFLFRLAHGAWPAVLLLLGAIWLQGCVSARPWRTCAEPCDGPQLQQAERVRVDRNDGSTYFFTRATYGRDEHGEFIAGQASTPAGKDLGRTRIYTDGICAIRTRRIEAARIAANLGLAALAALMFVADANDGEVDIGWWSAASPETAPPECLGQAASRTIGAAAVHMALPQDFPVEMAVLPCLRSATAASRTPFAFSPFQVTQFRLGLATSISGPGKARQRQNYRFKLEDSGRPAWRGQCRRERAIAESVYQGWAGTIVAPQTVSEALECSLRDQRTGATWALAWSAVVTPRLLDREIESEGALTHGDIRFEVQATYELAGQSGTSDQPSGFLFARDQRWIGALETIPPESLRADDTVDRGPMVAASSALLLSRALDARASRMNW